MLNSVDGLTWKRYIRRVEPLVNPVLMSYGLHIFWILSSSSLTQGRHTVMSFRVLSSILLSRFLGADVIRSGLLLLRGRLCLKLTISSWNTSVSLLMFLLGVVSNGLFLSLPYMDDGSWNRGTVQWRRACDTQITRILALGVLLIHRGRVIYYLALSPRKKAGGCIGRKFVEITIKMKTIIKKNFMIKIIKLHLKKFRQLE